MTKYNYKQIETYEQLFERIANLSTNWLKERLGSRRQWTPAERRLGELVAKLTERDYYEKNNNSFLVMPAKRKKKP